MTNLEDLHRLIAWDWQVQITEAEMKEPLPEGEGAEATLNMGDVPHITDLRGDEDGEKLQAFHAKWNAFKQALQDLDGAFHDLWGCADD
jgi:hypothetical protein